ncbi:hypothetical protein [Streptomyces odontomachi]|uniref:hypothetical protein n=1 Tax=Streptomyces odontomachi TaxID=2944940 RepID=UPI00210F01C8|nr:hypothetical protein [Streptomyces sp. ODS25]
MQSPKYPGRLARTAHQDTESAFEAVHGPDPEGDPADSDDTFDTYRVVCPDCAQSIALLADEDVLPEHALCPSAWDPFGLQVCAGTGRPSVDALAADADGEEEPEAALLLTLPQGLDWRTQPFSHVGGPGSRPIQVPQIRRPAA